MGNRYKMMAFIFRWKKAMALVLCTCAYSSMGIPDSFTFSAANMSSSTAKGKERTMLSGEAKIVSDSTTISADTIELTGKDWQFAKCSGTVSVNDGEKGIFLTAQNVIFDRILKTSQVKGQCIMEDKKNKVIIKGGYLENDDVAETTIIQIGVRILKEDMVCRSEFAFYNRKTQTLDLTGMPVVIWKGDEYRASRISVNLDTEDIRLDGDVTGVITKADDTTGKSSK